jgi:hypothetical protein
MDRYTCCWSPAEKERDDVAIEKMMLSLQATKMKIDSLGWVGFGRVQIDLGLLSIYLQGTSVLSLSLSLSMCVCARVRVCVC